MNQRLSNLLDTFPSELEKATSVAAIAEAIASIEAQVLKSNLEENSTAPVVAQDFLVGEANTRGLSFKLNLLRQVASANFTQVVRIGVHGGTVKILGQQDNIDITLAIYNALIPAYESVSKTAFTEYADSQKGEEGPAAHRVGWINKFLVDAPDEAFASVANAREAQGGSNRKIADLLAQKTSDIVAFKATLTPPKPVKEPKAPKPKKTKAAVEASTDSENVAPEDIPNDAE